MRFAADSSRSIDESASGNEEITPVSLGVQVDLTLAEGATHRFTVNLLHTSLIQEKEP